MPKTKKGHELVVLTEEELAAFENEIIGRGPRYEGNETTIYSGKFRGVAGQFVYVKAFNSIIITDSMRGKMGLKPKKT